MKIWGGGVEWGVGRSELPAPHTLTSVIGFFFAGPPFRYSSRVPRSLSSPVCSVPVNLRFLPAYPTAQTKSLKTLSAERHRGRVVRALDSKSIGSNPILTARRFCSR